MNKNAVQYDLDDFLRENVYLENPSNIKLYIEETIYDDVSKFIDLNKPKFGFILTYILDRTKKNVSVFKSAGKHTKVFEIVFKKNANWLRGEKGLNTRIYGKYQDGNFILGKIHKSKKVQKNKDKKLNAIITSVEDTTYDFIN